MNGHSDHDSIVDPRQVFLTPAEVMTRYRWGRTKGYQMMRSRADGFPRAAGGRYRLGSLPSWEDDQSGLASDRPVSASPAIPSLPARRRPGRKAAS